MGILGRKRTRLYRGRALDWRRAEKDVYDNVRTSCERKRLARVFLARIYYLK